MLELIETAAGVILPVQAQPGARKNAITGLHAGRLKVAVTQAPEKGKANQALIKLLAELLELKRHQIALVSGETSSQKKFCVAGVNLSDLRRRIESLLDEPGRG